jgi:transposase
MDEKQIKTRKKYTKEFKQEALGLWSKGEKSQEQIERDLGLATGSLTRWNRELRNDGVAAFRGQGNLRPIDEEMARLRREVIQLRQERDILKKAMGVVTRENK